MITKVTSIRKACTYYEFDNGSMVSVIFGPASYTENMDAEWDDRFNDKVITSSTVEVMVEGNDAFIKWFEKKYNDNPGGYIPVSEIPAILKKADSRAYSEDTK